jgi:PAS domain S-box-containing protein
MKETINFEHIFQYTSNGMLVTDASGIITHINSKAEAVLKLDASIHLGEDIIDILPLTGNPIQQCLKAGKPILGYQVLGKKAQLVLNITPIVRDGVMAGAVCNFQELSTFEISAKKTLSYKTLNRQFETIFHSSSDGIWVCDGKGIIININAASERLNGIKASAVIGYNINELLEKNIFDQSVTAKVMASRQQETVMQYIAKTNKFLLSTGTPSIDKKGNIVLIVINERDMTELNTLRRRFEQSQKVKEKYQEELSELSLLQLERNSIIADSSKMRHILQMSLKLSHIGASNILILGESGTGKGLLAKLIHKNSKRQKKPFVEINCAALPENLLEAELFGYEKGAFTGASDKGKIGLFELAQGGTLFLDEIGDMPILLQSKLLKYLDNQEIRRIGGTESIKVTCSTIAATNQNLSKLVKQKQFREDLYYRLSSFILEIPPLKERTEDISGLIRFYLTEFNSKYQCNHAFQLLTYYF